MYFTKKSVMVVLVVIVSIFLALFTFEGNMLTGASIVEQDLSIDLAVTACGDLNLSETTYDLQNNVLTVSSACFTIRNSSQIVDCHGFMITYGNVATGIAINNTGGYNNITIRN